MIHNYYTRYCFLAHSRTSQNSETGVESDDLLFPIEEVVETVAMENLKCESGNMACTQKLFECIIIIDSQTSHI